MTGHLGDYLDRYTPRQQECNAGVAQVVKARGVGETSTLQQRFPTAVMDVLAAKGRAYVGGEDPFGYTLLRRVDPVLLQGGYRQL